MFRACTRSGCILNNHVKFYNLPVTRNVSWFPWSSEKIVSSGSNQELTSHFLPEPPTAPDIELPTYILNSIGEETFESLGLWCWWWPPSWIQMLLESLHVDLNVPWWGSIISLTIVAKMISLPILIKSRNISNKFGQLAPKLQDSQNRFKTAQMTNDIVDMMKVMDQMKELKPNMVSPYKMFLIPALNIPIFMSCIMGLRGITDIPVLSMQTGGLYWFADLTIPDPFYILPLSVVIVTSIQMHLALHLNQLSTTVVWIMRGLPIVGLFFLCKFPASMLLYITTNSFFSISFLLLMKLPAVQKLLRYQEPTPLVAPKKKSGGILKNYKSSANATRIFDSYSEIETSDAEKWMKAGKGEIPKTFKFDPTKKAV